MRKSREWQLTNSQAAVEVIPSSRTRGAIKTVSEQSDTVFMRIQLFLKHVIT